MDNNVEAMRAEILEQLQRRELFVPNADRLPIDELLHVYNAFIVPHPRRERRERARPLTETPSQDVEMTAQIVKCITVVSVFGNKRPSELAIDDQTLLGNMRKRFKFETRQ